MKIIDQIYINGQFVKPLGTEELELINPANKQVIGRVVLGNAQDTRLAIAAAKAAFKTYSKTTVKQRTDMLQRLHDALMNKFDQLTQATIEEYGAPVSVATMLTKLAADAFLHTKEVAEEYEFTRIAGKAKVHMEPLGVVGAITPWNANSTHIANKLAPAL
ncbi:aldehyde dehydrogenase family protein, partial [Paenibacillus sepulcri]|nr:aldehyde dehydrogenase family protein [Paenibacillus sepulcri]